jgi:putative transcriptional regulator
VRGKEGRGRREDLAKNRRNAGIVLQRTNSSAVPFRQEGSGKPFGRTEEMDRPDDNRNPEGDAMSQRKKKTAARQPKRRYMSDSAFSELRSAFEDALAYERGRRPDLRVTRVPLPGSPKAFSRTRIVRMREHLNFSQGMFARLLNVSPRTVQDWEQGRRTPSDTALKLLAIAEKHPEVLLET